jgi:hypothetical protein
VRPLVAEATAENRADQASWAASTADGSARDSTAAASDLS